MKRLSLLIPLFLVSCEGMDPATQAIIAQGAVDVAKAYVSRSGKSTLPTTPPDGPDTSQKYDPVHGYNHGNGPFGPPKP
jgi:hypothetical protein